MSMSSKTCAKSPLSDASIDAYLQERPLICSLLYDATECNRLESEGQKQAIREMLIKS